MKFINHYLFLWVIFALLDPDLRTPLKIRIQSGYKIAVLRIRIRDPGLGTFLTPGSGIRDEQPGSYFLEFRNHFFAFLEVKILKFFDEDPGSGMETVRIRDGKSRIRDPRSGINIPDPQHCKIGCC
jgi:hypothetical protein